MKFLVVIITIISFSVLRNYSKGNNELLQKDGGLTFIKNYPVKIDGGASFFTYDSVSLDSKKFILIISKNKQAFIQTSEGFVYFKHSRRHVTEKGYKDSFSNKQFQLTLDITNIRRAGKNESIRSGTLKLEGAKTLIFQIHGKVEEYDKYNYPNRLRSNQIAPLFTPIKMTGNQASM